MDNIAISFSMKVGVEHIRMETKTPMRLVPFSAGVFDVEGNPIKAYHKEKSYDVIAYITIVRKELIFSDLYAEFNSSQESRHWKSIGISFGGYLQEEPAPYLEFTGTAYSMKQWTEIYNFIQEFIDAHS